MFEDVRGFLLLRLHSSEIWVQLKKCLSFEKVKQISLRWTFLSLWVRFRLNEMCERTKEFACLCDFIMERLLWSECVATQARPAIMTNLISWSRTRVNGKINTTFQTAVKEHWKSSSHRYFFPLSRSVNVLPKNKHFGISFLLSFDKICWNVNPGCRSVSFQDLTRRVCDNPSVQRQTSERLHEVKIRTNSSVRNA